MKLCFYLMHANVLNSNKKMQIHNQHIGIIVRQITSKVLISKDYNV